MMRGFPAVVRAGLYYAASVPVRYPASPVLTGLLKRAEVTEQPPEDNKNKDGADAPSTEFLRAISCSQSA